MKENYMPVGVEFEYKGKKYIAEESSGDCIGCASEVATLMCLNFSCQSWKRIDKKEIIFKEVK